ncbi:hypothetical protein ACFYXC_37140 [Streptomyces sp. NPDC002701]|uniref:hypothetical protein n=1 Tax=Streptomyces sp. NPDC002701 TaxID=3364661 RepID=UPI00367CB92B
MIRPAPLRADFGTPPEERLECRTHVLAHDVYPIVGSQDSLNTLTARVPSADASWHDPCLTLDTVRPYLADTQGWR